jgi:hypothetical protein
MECVTTYQCHAKPCQHIPDAMHTLACVVLLRPCAGMKQSKANPLLMLQSSQISPVLRFQTQQDRNDIAAAITQAQTQQQAAAQAAAMPAAPTASIAAGAGGQSATQKLKPEERQALLENNP